MNIYHKYFIQYMLKNGIATINNALNFCDVMSRGEIDNIIKLKTLVIEINREISKQWYKIVFTVCEVTNKKLAVWLNTKDDDISKHQISFSQIELEYFNAIFKEIVNADDHRITFIVCLNICSSLTSQFSRDSGQKVLNKWLKGGYYVKHGDCIYLGMRTILEFTSYLRSQCPDSICNLCSELVFVGKKCGHCDKVLHSYCLSTYLKVQEKCPCCKNQWIMEAESNNSLNSEDVIADNDTSVDNTLVNIATNGSHHFEEISPELAATRHKRSQRNRHIENHDNDEAGPSCSKRNR